MWGDLLVIDWDLFSDNTTYKEHHKPASGIDAVFLEGRMTAQHSSHSGLFQGSAIRIF